MGHDLLTCHNMRKKRSVRSTLCECSLGLWECKARSNPLNPFKRCFDTLIIDLLFIYWGFGVMFTVFKNFITLVRNLINGDEYISDRSKITYSLYFLALMHISYAVLFMFCESAVLALYNLIAFLYVQILIRIAANKHLFTAATLSAIEILVFSIISTIALGDSMNFNLYCFSIIPMVFYVSSTIKDFKKHSYFSLLFSILSLAAYAASVIIRIQKNPFVKFPFDNIALVSAIEIINSIIIVGMITVFLFLFTWEMKNNTATLEKRNQQLLQFANVDPLTKLPNRRCMMQTLNLAMHELSRGTSVFSIILGDIDNFKKINDNYGHDMGDKVLLTVAHTISSQLRECDAVCRWGGEEILILIRGDAETATAIAERIRLTISTTEVVHNNNAVRVSMTFGVTQAEIGYRIEQIIQSADNRMYYGKQNGKNRVISKNP